MKKGEGMRDARVEEHRKRQLNRLETILKYRRKMMTHKEIAGVTGISQGTVVNYLSDKYLIKLGKEDLKDELAKISKRLMRCGSKAIQKRAALNYVEKLRLVYDRISQMRLDGMCYEDISHATGYSVSVIKKTFAADNLEKLGKGDMIQVYEGVARKIRSLAAKDRNVEKGTKGALIREHLIGGTTPDEIISMHSEWSKRDTMRVIINIAAKLYDDGTTSSGIDSMILGGYDYSQITAKYGVSDRKLRQIKNNMDKTRARKSYCSKCGAHLLVDELTRFRGLDLCRNCLYLDGADPPIDTQEILSAMSNNRRPNYD
jgi:hypothetical protein